MKKYLIKLIFISICAFGISACAQRKISHQFSLKDTGLDKLINIDGYYKVESPYGETLSRSVMFYRTGIVCYTLGKDLKMTFQKGVYPPESWGGYYVKEDTIFVQTITSYGLMQKQNVNNYRYKILSEDSIVLLSNDAINLENMSNHKDHVYSFHPLESRIDSADCWLLKKKWFYKKE